MRDFRTGLRGLLAVGLEFRAVPWQFGVGWRVLFKLRFAQQFLMFRRIIARVNSVRHGNGALVCVVGVMVLPFSLHKML